MPVVSAVCLLLVVAGGLAAARALRSGLPLAVAAGAALAWPVVPRGLQGPLLFLFAPDHGVHVSDLLTPVLLAIVVVHALRLLQPAAPAAARGVEQPAAGTAAAAAARRLSR